MQLSCFNTLPSLSNIVTWRVAYSQSLQFMRFSFSLCINNTEDRFEFYAGGEGGKNNQSCHLLHWKVSQYGKSVISFAVQYVYLYR